MLKPGYPVFAARARRWIGEALRSGRQFDIIHQLTPLALRYATPAYGFGIPYVVGPLGGSLDTPKAFAAECGSAPVFTRLREIDRYRLEADPWLRRSYRDAACVIGVAPYVRDLLRTIPLRRFEVMSELGIDEPLPPLAPAHACGRRIEAAACGARGSHEGPARCNPRIGDAAGPAGRHANPGRWRRGT